MMHVIGLEDDLHVGYLDQQDRNFNAVSIKYINLDSVKSTVFTTLESSTSQHEPTKDTKLTQ